MTIGGALGKCSWAMPMLLGLMLTGCADEAADAVEDEDVDEVGSAALGLGLGGAMIEHSAWSGLSGATKVTLSRLATYDQYVQGFTMKEKSDEPCYFSASFYQVDDPNAWEGDEVWNRCDGGPGNAKDAWMPNSYRTTGVAVCLNSARDKMKGFALIGRYTECILDPNGTTPDGAPCNGAGPRYDLDEERDGCPNTKNGLDDDWEDEAECPPGWVVTGIEINHRDGGGNRRMMTGARAICSLLTR